MKFRIFRTSDRNEKEKPCANAKNESVIEIDSRDAKWLDGANKEQLRKRWFRIGMNHHEKTKGKRHKIVREFHCAIWTIEIKNLLDLLELERKYGEIIIRSGGNKHQQIKNIDHEIEIYDNYRE